MSPYSRFSHLTIDQLSDWKTWRGSMGNSQSWLKLFVLKVQYRQWLMSSFWRFTFLVINTIYKMKCQQNYRNKYDRLKLKFLKAWFWNHFFLVEFVIIGMLVYLAFGITWVLTNTTIYKWRQANQNRLVSGSSRCLSSVIWWLLVPWQVNILLSIRLCSLVEKFYEKVGRLFRWPTYPCSFALIKKVRRVSCIPKWSFTYQIGGNT